MAILQCTWVLTSCLLIVRVIGPNFCVTGCPSQDLTQTTKIT